jgi:hypothetical protein
MEKGTRVKFVGPETDMPPEKGREGTYLGPGKLSMRIVAHTEEQHEERKKVYAETHSMIHWDGCTYPWNCTNDRFEKV